MSEESSGSDLGLGAYLSPLAVLALSFGYAVGWGGFCHAGHGVSARRGPCRRGDAEAVRGAGFTGIMLKPISGDKLKAVMLDFAS